MIQVVQENRTVRVKTVLPDNELIFRKMSGRERVSDLFRYDLELVSENGAIDIDQLLGQAITIAVERPDNDYRFFHGCIVEGAQCGKFEDLALYQFIVRPWLWFLTKTQDCRIFQEQSVPDIVKSIFREQGFTDFQDCLSKNYEKRNYCVQYCESDFDFVSRLLQQEGIYYYFKHEDGRHVLVLADDISAHDTVPGYEHLPYYPDSSVSDPEVDKIMSWNFRKRVQPGSVVVTDYNFVNPGDNMQASRPGAADHAHADMEIFDYTGEYPSSDEGVKQRAFGEHIARNRMEAYQADFEVAQASGAIYGVGTGDLFKLSDCDRDDQNREYLIISTTINMEQAGFLGGDDNEGFQLFCHLDVMPSCTPYRPQRTTRKPKVYGPQTAKVVGKSGEEIWTDRHGRVKLQFHWDRYGKHDEMSSCWVRVSQAWAGSSWGAIHVPRIGQEVIVEFVNGDPDQPIVTGRVYNGDNEVPYDLPANATQSGIKSRSSKGGGPANFNEIRMEDKKGEEELYIHAERNHTQITEADKSESVGNDRSKSVTRDQSEKVGRDKEIIVEGKHTETITGDTKITVQDGNYRCDVNTGRMDVVSKSQMYLESKDSIMLKVGGSSITITPAGITISATAITVDAGASLELLAGAAITENAPSVEITADAMAKVESTVVDVNGSAAVTIKGASVSVN